MIAGSFFVANKIVYHNENRLRRLMSITPEQPVKSGLTQPIG